MHPLRGKQFLICHAGSTKGFVLNSLDLFLILLCGQKLSESYADYHGNMNGDVFEDWLENFLLKNLPQNRKVLIVMDSAKYLSRLSEKTPTMNMKKMI